MTEKTTSSTSRKPVPAPDGSTAGVDAEIDQIIAKAQAEGLQLTGREGLLGGLIKKAVESAMNAEMTSHLGYEKYAPEGHGTGNSRNGTTTATVHTNVDQVEIDRPRDRNGEFDSMVLPKGTRRLGEFDDMVLSLFAKGMTTRDIAEHLEITYDAKVSHETIANITDAINETVKEWRSRALDEVYPIVYIDAIRLRIRDGGQVRIKACHLAVGVDMDGRKQVLGMWIEQTEGAKFWAGVLTELRNRGVRDVLIVCCDGLKGLPEAIAATWPVAKVQTCVVHLIRNSMRYASWKDRKAIATLLKPIYTVPTLEAAEQALEAFADSDPGRRCPAAVDAWRRAWEEFIPFLEFPPEIRRVVYTTNAIESMNYQLRKVTKNRGQFPSDEAAYKLLYLAICDIEARTTSRGGGKTKTLLMRGSSSLHWTAALNQFALCTSQDDYPTTFNNPPGRLHTKVDTLHRSALAGHLLSRNWSPPGKPGHRMPQTNSPSTSPLCPSPAQESTPPASASPPSRRDRPGSCCRRSSIGGRGVCDGLRPALPTTT